MIKCLERVRKRMVLLKTFPAQKLYKCMTNAWEQLIEKPGFHIVVSVMSVVQKKFIRQIQLYGNLPYNRSMRQKRQIQRILSPATDTTRSGRDTTAFCSWKPSHATHTTNAEKCVPECNSVFKMAAEVTLNARSPLSWRNFSAMNPFTANSQKITRTNK